MGTVARSGPSWRRGPSREAFRNWQLSRTDVLVDSSRLPPTAALKGFQAGGGEGENISVPRKIWPEKTSGGGMRKRQGERPGVRKRLRATVGGEREGAEIENACWLSCKTRYEAAVN